MANLPLAFAELLGGGVLLTAGISGSSVTDVFHGSVSLKSFDAGGAVPAAAASPAVAPTVDGAANPFARASNVRIGRTDQGVDASMAPGSPIVAPFPSR